MLKADARGEGDKIIQPESCLEHQVGGCIEMGTYGKVFEICDPVERFRNVSQPHGQTESGRKIPGFIQREIDEGHDGICLAERGVIPITRIKHRKPDQRVVVSPFPVEFSIGHLLDDEFEGRKMGLEHLQLGVLGIDKPVMNLALDDKV